MVRFSLYIALALCLGATALASVVPDYTSPEEWIKKYDGKTKKNNIAVVQVETKVSPSGQHTVHVNGQKLADHEREQIVDLDRTVRTGHSTDKHEDHKKVGNHGNRKNNIAVVQVKTKVDGKGKNNIAVVQVKTNVHSSAKSLAHGDHASDIKHSVRTAADDKETKKLFDIADMHRKGGKKNNIAVVQVQTVVHTYKHNDHGKNNIAVVQVETNVHGDKHHGNDNNIAVVQVVTKVHPSSYAHKKVDYKDEKADKKSEEKKHHENAEYKNGEYKKEEEKKDHKKKEEKKEHKH